MDLAYFLTGSNQILASAITILSFSLLIYMLARNVGSAVGRAFSVLLGCVCFAYAGDVALFRVNNVEDAITWLLFQWVGIAFIPAAYLHFADALLRTTNAHSSRRRVAMVTAYIFGFILVALAIQTDYLVRDPFYELGITQFRAGPFFWAFATYYLTTLIWGTYKVYLARRRCLTSGAKRRMTYLTVALIAPALGVFPYLLIASEPTLPSSSILSIMLIGNMGVAMMIVLMAYSVAFFGALTPERVVKHNLVYMLLRGSLVAAVVIGIVQILPSNEVFLGLPREFFLVSSITVVLVLAPILIDLSKPLINRLIFYQDRQEIYWLSELDRRLLTTTDLQQALENILIVLCELLRVETGFIYNMITNNGPRLEAQIGPPREIEQAITRLDIGALTKEINGHEGYHFIAQEGYWFVLLQNQARNRYLGLLGIQARSPNYDLNPMEEARVHQLLTQVEFALEDRMLQYEVFLALQNIIPEIERVQRLSSAVQYTGSSATPFLDPDNPINQTDFSEMVRDALKHYWGGPKLTDSPLLALRVVQEQLAASDSNPVNALRTVLVEAIERQRPDGERQMTAADWLIYNILELKFVQGLRVRDIAKRLAMSESDLYRKQKLAIEEVARTLREMETKQ